MDIRLDEQKSILYVTPSGPLTADNFLQLTSLVDPYLEQHRTLKGLVIEAAKFPGWKNLDGFMAHIKFIKNHQAKIQKIAIVTDSKVADIIRKCVGPFVKPEIKHFSLAEATVATEWIEH